MCFLDGCGPPDGQRSPKTFCTIWRFFGHIVLILWRSVPAAELAANTAVPVNTKPLLYSNKSVDPGLAAKSPRLASNPDSLMVSD